MGRLQTRYKISCCGICPAPDVVQAFHMRHPNRQIGSPSIAVNLLVIRHPDLDHLFDRMIADNRDFHGKPPLPIYPPALARDESLPGGHRPGAGHHAAGRQLWSATRFRERHTAIRGSAARRSGREAVPASPKARTQTKILLG